MQVARSATTSRVTRNFAHLLNGRGHLGVYRAPARLRNPLAPKNKDAHPADRIKFWNIVPGDKVRLVRGPKRDLDRVVEVLSVNKFRNLILLKDLTEKTSSSGDNEVAVRVHYSNVQLHIGKYEFPPEAGSEQPITRDVFATRLGTTKPKYDKYARRWLWERFAAKTAPLIPDENGEVKQTRGRTIGRGDRLAIPWPEIPAWTPPNASQYDTPASEALKITWMPTSPTSSPLGSSILRTLPRTRNAPSLHVSTRFITPAIEDTYIRSMLHPTKYPLPSTQLPIEQFLVSELSNPHSRAKKQERWQDRQAAKLALRDEMIREEMADLRGRKRAVARREAIFRWNARIEREEKQRNWERWVQRGGLQEEVRQKARKLKKKEKQAKKLKNLVLIMGEKNQVVPGEKVAATV